MGTETSPFVSGGRQGDLFALPSLACGGGSVISRDKSHVETGELNGYSFFVGVTIIPTVTSRGVMIPEAARKALAETEATLQGDLSGWRTRTTGTRIGYATGDIAADCVTCR